MPAVGMRRSTRVFGTRVLQSGRRLWKAGPGEVGKQQHYTRAADNVEEEWIDLLDNSGDERIPCKENGRHDDIVDLHLEIKMDIDENTEEKPDEKTEKRWGAVYQRKRKRFNTKTGVDSLSYSDRMYGKQFFRKQGRKRIKESSSITRTCNLNSGVVGQDVFQGGLLKWRVLVSVLETSSCGSSSYGLFSCVLNSILSYMSRFSLRLWQLSAFLYSQPISNVYSSHGIHFLQDCTSITSSGVCKIFGSRCCVPLFELDFSAAPFVFLCLHLSLLLTSAILPYTLVFYWNGMVAGGDNIIDGEELRSCIPCDGDKSGSRTGVSGNSISEKRRALVPSSAARKSVSRILQLKNTVSYRIIKKRRRSLRSRRGRNISPFVVRKASGTLLTNLPSRYAGIPFSPVTSNHELISPIRGNFTTNIKELKSTWIGLTEDTDTSSCTTNILVIESDKCYREEGATVTMEKSASSQWFIVIKRDGITRYNLMAQQVMRPCSCNRVTHAIIWTIDNGWKLEFPNRRDWSIFKKLYKECSDHNMRAPTVSVIPVPGVLEVSSYDDDSNTVSFKRPESYITWKDDELTRALMKGTANYDLDSDDEAWLNKFNNEILPENELDKHVSADVLELIINSFEKGFYCGEEDYSDVRAAVNLCKNLERREVLEAVHSYWMKKRKDKRFALNRVFQCYQPRRTPILPKVILRKKRSFQRQGGKAGRDKQQTFLQVERDVVDEQKIIVKIQEAKATAKRSESVAVLKRKRTQMLMETADLATYKANMALRIAQAVRLVEPREVAVYFCLG